MAGGSFIFRIQTIEIIQIGAGRVTKPIDYKQPLSKAKKIPRSAANYRLPEGNIAAIDFGTTSVSIAYTTKGDEKVTTIILDTENHDTRVPNAVLLKRDKKEMKVAAFGVLARKNFSSMRSGQHADHVYFERIKMLMKRTNKDVINRQSLVESFSGEKFYLVEVIAFILKYLKDLLIDRMSRGVRQLKTTDFDWVITVPAIWDARGKRMMREAAYLAGLLTESGGITQFTPVSGRPLPLPNETDPDKLSLALEPESAALYSQETVVEQIKSAGSKAAINPPSDYMVIDIGGGTVDITAHAEVPGGGVRIENVPTGNACGGTQINEAFSKMLQEIVNDPGFKKFLDSGDHSQHMAAVNKILYTEFEQQKVLFGQDKIEKEVAINLASKFVKFYHKTLEDRAAKFDGIEYDNDQLYITKVVVESHLFGPTLDGIIKCTLEAIEDNEYKADTFYLVGGFGGCKYVHEKVTPAIEKVYQSKGKSCHVVVPPSPQLAVATGAAMWRKNPDKVKARRVDATYGIGVSVDFDPEKHDEHYRFYNEDQQKYKCGKIFDVFLEKGDMMSADDVITSTMLPYGPDSTQLQATIYCTPNLGVQYTEDKNGKPTVSKIGELVIDIPNPDNLPREQRRVDITMDFSGTEIQAKAKYRVTEKEVKTVCDFLSAQ